MVKSESDQRSIAKEAYALIVNKKYTLSQCAILMNVSKSGLKRYLDKYITGNDAVKLQNQLNKNRTKGQFVSNKKIHPLKVLSQLFNKR